MEFFFKNPKQKFSQWLSEPYQYSIQSGSSSGFLAT